MAAVITCLLYTSFLTEQKQQGVCVEEPQEELDVYDLAALAYLYRRMRETEVISEAHHIVVDEAQDFGVMVYAVLKECVRSCTYTVMGDVSQNIRMDYGISDWEGVKNILLTGERDNFCVLRKSYRNTVEIANFASDILAHGEFPGYGAEPVIRHGEAVGIRQTAGRDLYREAAKICKGWQTEGDVYKRQGISSDRRTLHGCIGRFRHAVIRCEEPLLVGRNV